MSPMARRLFRLGFLRPYFYTLSRASHLFALSEADEATLRSRFPDRSISVVPNGVSPPETGPDADERVATELGIDPETDLLLFVGKVMESKGVSDLLEASEMLANEATLVVAGPLADPRYTERFERAGVRYVGYAEQDLLDDLYARADVFVFPTRSDVFPLVTLEAMAAGTPVITTDVGGLPEQVTDETGVIVPRRSPAELARATDRLLEDPAERERMGERARRRVEDEFSWESIARRVSREYERICSGSG